MPRAPPPVVTSPQLIGVLTTARVPGEMLQSVDFMNIHNISVIQGTSDYQHQPFGFLHKEKYNDIE